MGYKKKSKNIDKPYVSVITPTYNRREFIPQLLKMFLYQDYPQDKMELIIADDGTDKIKDLIPKDKNNIKYFEFDNKLTIGYKRNFLNEKAIGNIIVCMDDDDYYPPCRVSYSVNLLQKSKCLIAGCSHIYVYYICYDKILEYGPYNKNHAINSSMAYKKEYLINHKYNINDSKSEEKYFTNNFTEQMVQLDPNKTILQIAHFFNTIDKYKHVVNSIKITNYNLENIINDEISIKYYRNLISVLSNNEFNIINIK